MIKRFEAYFEDVMAGRKGGDWQAFALMVVAIAMGGFAIVSLPLFVWFMMHA